MTTRISDAAPNFTPEATAGKRAFTWTRRLAVLWLGLLPLVLTLRVIGAQPNRLIIVYPAVDATTIDRAPVEVVVRVSGVNASAVRAWLNGREVTNLLVPTNQGTVRARFSAPLLKHGLNLLVMKLGAYEATRTFRVRSLGLPGATAHVSGTRPPLMVPIQTRVIAGDGAKATDYAIKVGQTLYQAPPLSDGSATGFQVLLLDRHTLELVSNKSFPNANQAEAAALSAAFNDVGRCGESGCLAVIQSLQKLGYTSCPTGSCPSQSTLEPATALAKLGASSKVNYLSGESTDQPYTLISNVSLSSAAAIAEGVACAKCGLGPRQITGALILDNNSAYTFVYPGRATFATGTGAAATSNTVTIGGTPNGGSYRSSDIPPGAGAFQVAVFYRDSLQLVYQNTFNFDRLASDDPNVWTMQAALQDVAASQNYLAIVSSIGNLAHDSWRPQWSRVAQAIERLGGTYSVFVSLNAGDDYAFVGDSETSFGNGAVEASSVVTNATKPAGAPTRPSNLRGVLAQNLNGYYRPILSNLTSTFDQSTLALLDAIALQLPTPWPTQSQQEQAAYQSLSLQLCCADIRAHYTNSLADPDNWQAQLDGLQYQSNNSFSATDFNNVKQQLKTEFTYVADVQRLYRNLKNLYTEMQTGEGAILDSAYNAVRGSLNPDSGAKVAPDWLATISSAMLLSGDVASIGGGPTTKLMLDMAFVSLNLGIGLANSQTGVPLTNLDATVNELKQKSVEDFNASLTATGNIFDLILSDWGRLQGLGAPLRAELISWDDNLDGVILQSMDRALRREYFTQLMDSSFQMGRWTNIAEGRPPELKAVCRYTQYTVIIDYDGNDTAVTKCDTTDSDHGNWLTLPTSPGRSGDGQNYDIWLLGTDVRCSPGKNGDLLAQLFAPLDPNDPSKLGIYKPYFFLYTPIHVRRNESCTR